MTDAEKWAEYRRQIMRQARAADSTNAFIQRMNDYAARVRVMSPAELAAERNRLGD